MLLAFLFPCVGLQATLNVDLAALFQVLADDFGELAPEHEPMPLGALLALTLAIVPALVGRQVDVGHRRTTRRVADFGVSSQITDEDDFVDAPP